MLEELKQLTTSVEQINTGLDALKKEHEKAKNDTDSLIEQKLARIAEDTAKSVEQLQERAAKLEAAAERPGTTEKEDGEDNSTKAAFTKFLRRGDQELSGIELKALSTDDNPNGGYLVPVGTLGMINGQIFETSPMRRIADVRSTTFKSVTIDLDDDEAEARWEGEGTSGGETDTPEIGRMELVTRKIEAEPAITLEDLQDSSVDMEAWLAAKVADKFARKENTAFCIGEDPLQPRGFLTYANYTTPGTYQRNAIEQIVNGSTTAPAVAGLVNLQGALKEEYQPGANWAMKRSTLVATMLLKGQENYHFLNLQPTTGSSGQALAPSFTLLEKPVVLMNDMPAIATDALSIAYGNFRRGYQILDRVGILVQRDPYTVKGKVKFYTTKRTGGTVKNFEAIKLLKFATN